MAQGWSVKFCAPDTEEDRVKIEIGRGGDSGSHRFWQTTNPQTDPEHVFPDDLRYANEIWIKITAEHGKEVHACVKYDGNNAQKMTFDRDEEHEVSKGDRDDCGC